MRGRVNQNDGQNNVPNEKVKHSFEIVLAVLGLFDIGAVYSFINRIVLFFKENNVTVYEIVVTALLVVVITAIIGVKIWRLVSFKAYHYPRSHINAQYPYIVENRKVTYTLQKNGKIIYKKEETIRATKEGLSYISDRRKWTGNESLPLPVSQTLGVKVSKADNNVGLYEYYNITFPTIRKGGTRKYSTIQTLKDPKSSSPWLANTTEVPIKSLTFVLDFGSKYKDRELLFQVKRSIESDIVLDSQVLHFDSSGRCEFHVPHLHRFRSYSLTWYEWV